jgi:lysophospholipase L1-like esterase
VARIRPEFAFAVALATFIPERVAQAQKPFEHWVTTWATAEALTNAPAAGRGGGRSAPSGAVQQGSAAALPRQSARRRPNDTGMPASFNDQTVRQVIRVSIGGRRVRVRFSTMMGAPALEIGAAHIAKYRGDGAIADGSDRRLLFGGKPSVTVQPGVVVLSDPLDFEIAALSDLAISIYLPRDTGPPTSHMLGLHTAYLATGDATGAISMPETPGMTAYAFIAALDVVAPSAAFTVVTLGDSITDGYGTTKEANMAWPTLLAKRLNATKEYEQIAVVNEGISGNQVLRDGAGVSALARLERDVLSLSSVRWVVLLEGINDINIRGRSDGPNAVTAEELIDGYRQIIARCHDHGIKIIGATLTPEEGVPTASERGEGIRQALNQWIKAKGNFDAVVDFDAVVRDPEHPARIRPEMDPGDHIHPNDSGNQAMAVAFDLRVFRN